MNSIPILYFLAHDDSFTLSFAGAVRKEAKICRTRMHDDCSRARLCLIRQNSGFPVPREPAGKLMHNMGFRMCHTVWAWYWYVHVCAYGTRTMQ